MDAFSPRTMPVWTSLPKRPLKNHHTSCLSYPLGLRLNSRQAFTGGPSFIFLSLYNGSDLLSIFRVSFVLARNLKSSWFSFWNTRLNHNYFFNLTLGKLLVVQGYPEIWTFQETWKWTLHQPEYCLISQRQGNNVPLLLLAFSIPAIMDCVVAVGDCSREIALMSQPPICVRLLEKVPGRKISTLRGHCSSHPVSSLTAIRVQSHRLFGTVSISGFFSSNLSWKPLGKWECSGNGKAVNTSHLDLHKTALWMVISCSAHLLTAACLVVAVDTASVTPKPEQPLCFPSPFYALLLHQKRHQLKCLGPWNKDSNTNCVLRRSSQWPPPNLWSWCYPIQETGTFHSYGGSGRTGVHSGVARWSAWC